MDILCKDCKTPLRIEDAEQIIEDTSHTTFDVRTIIVCEKCEEIHEVSDVEYLRFRIRKLNEDNDYARDRLAEANRTIAMLERENAALRRRELPNNSVNL